MRTGARATKQNYISIYISLYMKNFLKMGVYIYIYIYIYIYMKMNLHADFLKTCIEEDIIPKGLTSTSTLEDKDNETFNNEWKQILKNCSRELMSCLFEHYERRITLNATR